MSRFLTPAQVLDARWNISKADVIAMVRGHNFLPDGGNADHQVFRHAIYPDLYIRIVGHGNDIGPGSATSAAAACESAIRRQKEEARRITGSLRANLAQEEIVLPDVPADILPERKGNRLLLRDAVYPELGVALNIRSSPAAIRESHETIQKLRDEHRDVLKELMTAGYDVTADGKGPTLLTSRQGLPQKLLPIFDAEPETAVRLQGALQEARRQGEARQQRLLHLLERIETFGLVLDITDDGDTRRFRILEYQQPHIHIEYEKGETTFAEDLPEKPAIVFENSEKLEPGFMSLDTLRGMERNLKLYTSKRLLDLEQAIRDERYEYKETPSGNEVTSKTTTAFLELPDSASASERIVKIKKFLQEDAEIFGGMLDLVKTFEKDGFHPTVIERDNQLFLTLKYPALSEAEIILPMNREGSKLHRECLAECHHAMAAGYPEWYQKCLPSNIERIEDDNGQVIFRHPQLGDCALPAYVPGESLKPALDQLMHLKRGNAGFSVDLVVKTLVGDYGYTMRGARLMPPAGFSPQLKPLIVPEMDNGPAIERFFTAFQKKHDIIVGLKQRMVQLNDTFKNFPPCQLSYLALPPSLIFQWHEDTPVHVFPLFGGGFCSEQAINTMEREVGQKPISGKPGGFAAHVARQTERNWFRQ